MELDSLWKIDTYTATDQGTREYQQDAAKVITDGNSALAVLCDGMGGLKYGEMASNQTVQHFLRDMEEAWPVKNLPSFLEEEARRMDRMVCNLTDREHHKLDAGTTLVSAVVRENRLYWMSVGDSRLYILRDKRLKCLTKDHNYKIMLQEKLNEGKVDMDFYNSEIGRGEALTSYLGMGNISLIDKNESPFMLKRDDILLLCSDGLYKTLTEEQIEVVISESGGSISLAGDRLLKTAGRWGRKGQDNTTVILLKVNEEQR